ncbi:MAG: hypothetical protein QF752_07850 [Planctomycetota bacterium]|nr:hypothetical protein [Planctomycetota bacterium]
MKRYLVFIFLLSGVGLSASLTAQDSPGPAVVAVAEQEYTVIQVWISTRSAAGEEPENYARVLCRDLGGEYAFLRLPRSTSRVITTASLEAVSGEESRFVARTLVGACNQRHRVHIRGLVRVGEQGDLLLLRGAVVSLRGPRG